MKTKMNKVATFKQMEEVINRPWIDTNGILILLPIGQNKANEVRKTIEKEMDNLGEHYFKTKPRLIPTSKVVEKFNIDVSLIRREANRQRKYERAI